MPNPHRTTLAIIMLMVTVLACALPTIPLQDPGAISTAAAQTVIAGLTQGAPPETPFATLTANLVSPTPTNTAEPPTATLTPTSTPTNTSTPTQTLTFTPFFTPTPVVPLISVSVPTNCRSGPGKVYDLLGYLLVGVWSKRTAAIQPVYWYIQPRSPSNFAGSGTIRHRDREYWRAADLHTTAVPDTRARF
jgi:hypothetical protein